MRTISSRVLALLGAILGTLFLVVACGQGGGEPPEIPAFLLPQGPPRPVEVVFASPQGQLQNLPEGAAATLVFNQPMVPLEGLGQPGPLPPVTIQPPVAGTWEWRGTATLVFRPEGELPLATRFEVSLPAGLKSFSGQTLAQEYRFSFTTPRPDLVRSIPTNNTKFVRPEATLLLAFNQPIQAMAAAEAISLRAHKTDLAIQVRPPSDQEWKDFQDRSTGDEPPPESTRRNLLVVQPSSPMALGTEHILEIRAGLKGASGADLGLEKTRTIHFHTLNKFSVSDLSTESDWRPDGGLVLKFSNPVSPKKLVSSLRFEPEIRIPEWYAEDEHARTDIYLYLPMKARTAYQVSLTADLQDDFGNALGTAWTKSFTTTDFTPALHLSGGQGILEAQGDLRLPVGLRNIQRLRVRMARIAPEDLVPLLQNGDAFWSDQPFTPPEGYQVDEDWTPVVPQNQMVDCPLDLSRALGESRTGLVYVQLQAGEGKSKWDQRVLVQVTDLGLTGKFSAEDTLVWATSLSAAQPRPGLSVEIRDAKNQVRWSGRTDSKGLATAPGWGALGLDKGGSWGLPDHYVLIRDGQDLACLSAEGSTGISPWDFDLDHDWDPEARIYQAQTFTERGLYRAGEQVHLKGTLRRSQAGRWIVPEEVQTLEYVVYDSRDQKIGNGTTPVSSFGSFDQTLKLDQNAPSGFYRVQWNLPSKLSKAAGISGVLTGTTFRVEAYRPAQFEVTVESPDSACVQGESAGATIRGRYLFGAPMSGDKVRYSARLEPATFQPEAWEGFEFGTLRLWGENQRDQERILLREEGTLDEQGQRELTVSLEGISFEGPARLVVEGTVTSASRQAISGRTSAMVHPASLALGLKTGGSLRQAGTRVPVELVAVDPQGKAVPARQVQVKLLRREWDSVRKAGSGGRYEWVSEARDTEVSSQTVRVGNKPENLNLTPPRAGLYVVQALARDSKGRQTVAESMLYAWGGDYVAWDRQDEDRIDLVPDQKSYAPGQSARILVKSPYEKARALVTVERETVLDRFVVDVEGTADTVEVPISSDHVPNVFVSVILLQGRLPDAGFGPDGLDLGKPSFKIGYVNLPVESVERRLEVQVTPSKEVWEPRQQVSLQVQLRDSQGRPAAGEVCLAVVDEGVLSLIGYDTPDYFPAFYGSRPLSVRTSESRLDVIGQRSYGAKGANQGGGGGSLVGDYREDFVATAFWSPRLLTDSKGRAQVDFQLPDSLTRFRVMAVAQTRDGRFGSGKAALEVRKPLLLQPSVPRFARRGDRFQAGVLVFNNTGGSGEVLVEAEAAGVSLVERKTARVRLNSGQSREVLFDFEAPGSGDSEIGFRASLGSYRDSLKLPLPVHLSQRLETVATSGTVPVDSQVERVQVPGGVLPGTAVLETTVSSSVLSGVEEALNWLVDYPYGCLEQRLSRLVPLLLAGDLLTASARADLDKKALKARAQAELDELASLQVEGGGFAMWAGSDRVHDELTASAVRTLLEARERGFRVEEAMLTQARAAMKKALNQKNRDYPFSSTENLTVRASLLEALTRMDYSDPATLSALFKERDQLSVDAKVHLLRAAWRMKNSTVVDELRRDIQNLARVEAQTAWFDDPVPQPWLFSSSVRTTSLVLEAFLEQGESALAPRMVRWLMEARRDGHWGTTQQDAAALRALLAYRSRFESQTPDLEATVQVAGRGILQTRLNSKAPLASSQTTLEEGKVGEALEVLFGRRGRGTLHYDLRLRYAPEKDLPAQDEGFTVFRTVRPLEGAKVHIGPFRAGQTYRVTLTVLTPHERRYVVVEDPVPAGFEVVQTTFETESDEFRQVLSQAGIAKPWMGTFNHFEIEDSRVLLFADGLVPGEHTFEYLVRAMLPGKFRLPATRAEEMYHPEIFGTTPVQVVEVQPGQ
ncbi:MAG: alpha-2-macroglobulin family protein [Candidatus Xenobium sp.]|nr:hypothetical protein [Burkholderiales bacterium]